MSAVNDYWPCPDCTFNNEPKDLSCTMCYRVRINTKDQPVTWHWQAEDQWIVYDSQSINQIEAAYQANRPNVTLSEGWFAQQRGVYVIQFNRPNNQSNNQSVGRRRGSEYHLQLNLDSGMQRNVRRVADDEESLYEVISHSELDESDKCSVCQCEFEAPSNSQSNSQSNGERIVKLRKCARGHYFHHECIMQAIKLQHHCPYCQTPI